MGFIDELTIKIASGKGGPGKISFIHESGRPRGGPDGGDGGKGADVIMQANAQMNSLLELGYNRRFKAGDGEPGGNGLRTGPSGDDLVIKVPVGTIVTNESRGVIADFVEDKQEIIVAKGGRGGKGNAFFKSSVNQAPTYAQPGEAGEELEVHLELKLLADIGILGFPNVGKSTLISKISGARPKIADYAFTTLIPHLGVVPWVDGKSFVVADIPGLIPGASQGVGLGIQFLKHIERTSAFVHLIDVSPFSGRNPKEDFSAIRKELEQYDESHEPEAPLSSRSQIVVFNKIDVCDKDELGRLTREFKKEFGVDIFHISSATGLGIPELVKEMGKTVEKNKEKKHQ